VRWYYSLSQQDFSYINNMTLCVYRSGLFIFRHQSSKTQLLKFKVFLKDLECRQTNHLLYDTWLQQKPTVTDVPAPTMVHYCRNVCHPNIVNYTRLNRHSLRFSCGSVLEMILMQVLMLMFCIYARSSCLPHIYL